jgi:hypothetical protein
VELADDEVVPYIVRRNVRRRHMGVELRREIVAEMRAAGQSVRVIAESIGVGPTTVFRDIAANEEKARQGCGASSTVPNGTVENGVGQEKSEETSTRNGAGQATVTGKDGKTRPAKADPAKKAEPDLCARCRREGVVKGCWLCKELRRARPGRAGGTKKAGTKAGGTKKAAGPPEEEAPTDCFKNPVPKRCRDALFDPWVQQAYDLLCVTSENVRKARLTDGMRKRAKHLPFFIAQDYIDGVNTVIDYLDKLIDHMKANRPAAVCPCCAGKGCVDCRQSGLVPRALYDDLKKKAQDAVEAVREELESTGEIHQLSQRTGKDGRKRTTTPRPRAAPDPEPILCAKCRQGPVVERCWMCHEVGNIVRKRAGPPPWRRCSTAPA